ncbi:zinc finger protein [Theobroma cacao]|nr:zinc finger protein [Theobroma cacao]
MGSGGSKGSCRGGGAASASASSSSSSSSGGRRGRSKGKSRVFQSSCLGAPSGSADPDFDHQVLDQRNKGYASNFTNLNRNLRESEPESDEVKRECYRKVKGEAASDDEMPMPCISSSDVDIGASRSGSSSGRAAAAASSAHHSPSRCLSGFSFLPGNVSFRLSRANSLGSSRAYPVSPTSIAMLNHDDNSGTVEPQQLPHNSSSARNANLHSPIIFNDADRDRDRDRRVGVGSREPVERNVRFSRTLSVGRLRDRVLRRASLSDLTFCPLQQDRQLTNQTQALGGDRDTRDSATPSSTTTNTSAHTPSIISHNSIFNIQDHEVETSRSREARYHDLLEHRSNFLERRRRIRSQVRALQRLGSRFENLSGHERSCILSGQHRTGRCTCRVNNRDSNSNDDTSARASISRIVMLAEALFEVLDEIHQQSVVLSSRPSVSSIGSVPAPNEVVESLPVKVYTKSHKLQNDEAAQCYICLVEYEEGDSMRILPCNHEFHRACIDKWLKEIHRVCPLCRGDICRPDSLPAEN